MAAISFRVSEQQAQALRESAGQMGITQSQMLRDALRRYLIRLRAEHDIAAWNAKPLTEEEKIFAEIADWGPEEDWSDWADGKSRRVSGDAVGC